MPNKPKIIVVSPMLDMGPFLPLSISMIVSILEKGGFEVKLFDTTFYKMPSIESSINDLHNKIGMFKPANWDGYRRVLNYPQTGHRYQVVKSLRLP